MTTVYCYSCGIALQRKGSEVRRNQSGRYYCPACQQQRGRQNGSTPQQRGWRRGATA